MALDEAKPYQKTTQLARKERRYRRKPASPKQWAAIISEKQGPCRVCGSPPPNQMHHIVPRDRGGDDVPENIAPLCAHCHRLVEARDPSACKQLVQTTWEGAQAEPGARGGVKDEYSYCCEKAGDDWPERIYLIRYVRPSA